jgi:hypothetical protein
MLLQKFQLTFSTTQPVVITHLKQRSKKYSREAPKLLKHKLITVMIQSNRMKRMFKEKQALVYSF